jgi:twinkle protein
MPSQWPSRGSCPECGAGKAKVQHEDGHSYCFSCQTRFGEDMTQQTKVVPMSENHSGFEHNKTKGIIEAITDRKISKETAKKYNTQVNKTGNTIVQHIYQYFDKDGNYIANKVRDVQNKRFWSEGNLGVAGLFGQNIFNQSGKFITVCEGEVDAMSAYELMGSKWPVVSIKNGAPSALENCKQSFDYLTKFETIVLCFDNDEPGREAAQKVAQLFEPNKCKIVSLELKDANEYLKTGQREKFTQAWWNSKTYTPAGIINLADLGESLYDEFDCETCLYPWPKMNEKTYGLRTGELVTFTSGAGMGKSSIIRELMYHLMMNTKDGIGVLALEESIRNTAFSIMSVEANARLYIKEIRKQFTPEQLREWQKKTIDSKRFYAFDHFGSISNDEILDRVRHMAKALDCKWIFLDHLSILVSGQEDNGDERKSIDILMTKLRSLVEETGIALILVSHLRRPAGDRGHEDGREVSLSHLRGSASIAHLSDSVIALERNQQAEDAYEANTTTIRILKNRYTGDTGVSCYLYYDKDTGRMTQVDNPFMENNNEETL